MKRKVGMAVKRAICILLCILMLPLVKASASGFNDAYKALITWAKKGTYSQYEDPDLGMIKFSTRFLDISELVSFEIQYQDIVDPSYEDYLIVVLRDNKSKLSGRNIIMFITSMTSQYGEAYISWSSYSDNRETGKTDSYGNYNGEANIFMALDMTLDEGLYLDNYDATVSKSTVLADCKKDIKRLLEYTDKAIKEKDAKLSIQDMFSKITSKSVHNYSKSWIEREATCTVNGLRCFQCSTCGLKYYENIQPSHDWKLEKVVAKATDVHGSERYKCTRCGQTQTKTLCIGSAFKDMPAYDNWAHAGIDWAIYNNITNGTTKTTFSPNQACTRGQVVAFLWRAAGSPAPKSTTTPFVDVKKGSFYEKAVAWAVEKKITSGTDATHFSPDETCTRGQIVTFLWRFKGAPAVSTGGSKFTDVKAGAFYEKAVYWAEANGVTSGTEKNKFSPNDTCTRAQVVTFLYRAQKKK